MDDARQPQTPRISLSREDFLRDVLRHLSGTLQDIVGMEEASGLISVVGQNIGEPISELYRAAYRVERLSRSQVTEALVDLKRRIQGGFYVVEDSEAHITLENSACPFGESVIERPSLCMMTSNVFGTIAAENLGYTHIILEETIACGAAAMPNPGRLQATI